MTDKPDKKTVREDRQQAKKTEPPKLVLGQREPKKAPPVKEMKLKESKPEKKK